MSRTRTTVYRREDRAERRTRHERRALKRWSAEA
jgi:hypothetical protein